MKVDLITLCYKGKIKQYVNADINLKRILNKRLLYLKIGSVTTTYPHHILDYEFNGIDDVYAVSNKYLIVRKQKGYDYFFYRLYINGSSMIRMS